MQVGTKASADVRVYYLCLKRLITLQLCSMHLAYNKRMTQVVSSKSNLQLAYNCLVHDMKNIVGFRNMTFVSKPYDNRSFRQF